MRIGQLASETGATPKAIRLYEARGLLGQVARAGTYRHYGAKDVARVNLIRQAQGLGFRLAELDGLGAMHAADSWAGIATLLAERRAEVAHELRRLRQLDRRLEATQRELGVCDLAGTPVSAQACVVAVPSD